MDILYSATFYKDLKKIKDKTTRERVKTILFELKKSEDISRIKKVVKLKGHPLAYRIRIGNYRMGFLLQDENTIMISRFVKRNDIYKLFP
jgi:mRNA interferase RelE/StbE